jgi:hypothetical protein
MGDCGEREEGGSVDEVSLSLKRLCGGGLGGGAPSLEALEGTLRKSPDTGTSLHGGSFSAKGNLVCGGAHIPGILIDERRALVVGHHSVRDSIRGP